MPPLSSPRWRPPRSGSGFSHGSFSEPLGSAEPLHAALGSLLIMGDPTGRDDVLAAQGLATQGAAAMPGAAVGAMRFDGGRAPSNALPAGTQAMQQYVQLLGGLAEGKETGGGSAGGGGMDPQLANLQQQLSMLHFLQAAPQQQQQQQMQMQHLQQQLLQQQLWLRQSQAQQQKQLQQLQQLAYSMSQGSGTDAGWSHQHGSPDPTALVFDSQYQQQQPILQQQQQQRWDGGGAPHHQ